MEGKAHDLDLLKDRCERIALIDKMSIADQSGLRAVLPEARHQRQLQEGALVLFLCCRRLRLRGVQRQRRANRRGRGRDRQGERRRLLGRRHGHQLSGAFPGAAVHGLRGGLARRRRALLHRAWAATRRAEVHRARTLAPATCSLSDVVCSRNVFP